ncbi:MAG TPA: hypothetical protein VJU81_12590 [Methylomirabilota bacterium]|nr:hypothetical protein [Methylomirabilota bacterium]
MRPPSLPVALLAVLLLGAAPVAAQSRGPGAASRPSSSSRQAAEADRIAAEIVRTTREYVASLERMRAAYQSDAEALAEMVEVRRDLFQRQIISRRELEIAEELLAATNRKVEETDRAIKDANDIRQSVIGEAALHAELAKTPLPAGGYMATGVFIRFNGTALFTLGDLPRVERFFGNRFGRALPVSAYGQSPAHDRIGFDHRNAVDVAVHPDSPEGQSLMAYLQAQNIPFVAVRQAVPGSSTGAHIHIGQPSRRFTARP